MILTDAEIEPDPLLSPSLCDRCGACAAACSARAMRPEKTAVRTVCGREYEVYVLDEDLCRKCTDGGLKNRLHPSGAPDRYAAACVRACVARQDLRAADAVK